MLVYHKKKIMPRYKRKSYRRKTRKYKRKKRKRNYPITTMRVRGVTGFPDQLFVALKYNTTVNVVNVAGFGTYIFRMNSLFDPDFTGGGEQPLLFDQYALLYSEYEVKASKIRVQYLSQSQESMKATIYPANLATPLGDVSAIAEQPYAKSKWLNNANSAYFSTINNYMRVMKLEGRNTSSLNFVSVVTNNPSNMKYWSLSIWSPTGADVSVVHLDVTITYYSRFFRRRIVSGS